MRRTHQRALWAVLPVVALIALGSSAQASDRYVRVSPSFIVPAPHTYGAVVSPPPFYIYDPAPIILAPPQPFYVYHAEPVVLQPQPAVVYEIPTESVTVAPMPVGRIRYEYGRGYSSRHSYRHRGSYRYKFDGRDAHGGRVRYRYRSNNGRVRASLRYRP